MFAAVALAAYLVHPGDTLSGVAASHGVSLTAVEAANPQIGNPNLIFAGQSVNIPGGSGSTGSTAPAAQGSTATAAQDSQDSTAPAAQGSTAPATQDSQDSTAPAAQQKSTPAATTYQSPSSISSTAHTSTGGSSGSSGSSGSYSSSSLSDIPGVPKSFAACVAFRESTNGTNAAYNGGVYGIITASGINVNGQSLAAQKQAFSKLYAQYGGSPWAADGCPGT